MTADTIDVAVVVGTRPEVIKLAPVIAALEARGDLFRCRVISTGQHRQMLDQALETFAIRPTHDLEVMSANQPPARVAALVLEGLDGLIARDAPDWLLVQGDTTTVMAASLAAFYRRVKVGHVEAGLRSGVRDEPFPEEMNRRIADALSDLHFAPTEGARRALLAEGVADSRVVVTGNTVVDAVLAAAARPRPSLLEFGGLAEVLDADRRIVLVTAHRRESFGAAFREMLLAVRDLARRFAGDVTFVYPVHPNPNVAGPAHEILGGVPHVLLCPPLHYVLFVHVLRRAFLVLTDSGGVQEEAPSFGTPVLVMRAVTERPEGIEAGCARLVGMERERIVQEATRLLTDPAAHRRMSTAGNPYGDGRASERIVEALASFEARSP